MLAAGFVLGCSGPPHTDGRPGDSSPPRAQPPNVLVILIDDAGNDVIGAYHEHPRPARTPTIDALAARGLLFRNAWATPACSPSRSALLTGRYGRRYGIGGTVDSTGQTYEMPSEEVTIPEVLSGAPDAWDLAEVGKWHLATDDSPDGLRDPGAKGFPWYAAVPTNLDGESYYSWDKDLNGELVHSTTYATTDQIDDAIAQVHSLREPWFLYVALSAAHTPWYLPPSDLLGTNDLGDAPVPAKLYHAVLEAADTELARLMTEVDLDRTTVFCLADNGTPTSAILPPRSADEGKLTLYEGGINVPFVVAGPGIPPGAESEALVSVVDVLPTVAELAGVDPASLPNPLDGHSLLPLFADPSAPGPETVYSERFRPLGPPPYDVDERAIRDARYKYAIDETTGDEALLDLSGRVDDGPNLLTGSLDPDAQAALDRLRAAMDQYRSELTFATY